MLRFERTLAIRHLRSGGWQTVLTVSAVAAGVILVIFITSLIYGIQARFAELLTDITPHVTVTPRDREPEPLSRIDRRQATSGQPGERGIISSRIERQSPQRKQIENWPEVMKVIRGVPGVTAVAPSVTGQGFISRGGRRLGVAVFGADPEALDAVNNVTKYVFTGHYLGLAADEIVVTYKLAEDLGIGVGDRVRLTSSEGLSESFRIAGLYDTGQDQAFGSRAYVTLRAAQSLFATGTAVRAVYVRTNALFGAQRQAGQIAALLPYKAEAWMEQTPQFLAGLAAQNASAALISGFSLIASAFAIASVLIVSVLQKSQQIGILKSMGAKGRQILLVFTLEGLGIALIGATLGAAIGSGIVWGLTQIKQPVSRMGAAPESLFPAALAWQVVAGAMLAAILTTVLAAILPARRAARLDPVQVIR
jgi:lipoprotein-releasing system permease protein